MLQLAVIAYYFPEVFQPCFVVLGLLYLPMFALLEVLPPSTPEAQ